MQSIKFCESLLKAILASWRGHGHMNIRIVTVIPTSNLNVSPPNFANVSVYKWQVCLPVT